MSKFADSETVLSKREVERNRSVVTVA